MTKYKTSLIMNVSITVMVVLAYIMGTFNIKIIPDEFTSNGYDLLKYFTVQSNLLAGAASAVMAVYEYKLIKGKISVLPKFVYFLKYVSVIGVGVTMFTVVFYLSPIASGGYFSLFTNSNIFFHFLVPLFALVSYVLFEHNDYLRFKHTFLGLIHFLLYGVAYMIVAYTHLSGGVIPNEYNWYLLASPNAIVTVITSVVMTALVYGVCVLVWLGNVKIDIKTR